MKINYSVTRNIIKRIKSSHQYYSYNPKEDTIKITLEDFEKLLEQATISGYNQN